ncbi:type 1 fimbrial protein [Enterobacter asburiae]|uniref:fimbrial protein n=1 Tax=Enterobacter asburiae TaxID=61645 RepID=UPI002966D5F1|nr:type 1 fimbrial protein [Enterobacter asburiae]MDW3573077.1 type 1 fimbrial protein [Enterobacter asburiae]
MNKFNAAKLALAAAVLSATYSASAAVLTVNGTITPQTCTVAAESVNQNVILPTVGPSDLLNANNLSPVTFKLNVAKCDSSYNTVAVTLGSTSATSDVTGFSSVIASTGTASNVGIGIIGGTSVGTFPAGPLPVGTQSAAATLTTDGSDMKNGTLYLRAQIVPLKQTEAVSAGTVVGTATATFTYA